MAWPRFTTPRRSHACTPAPEHRSHLVAKRPKAHLDVQLPRAPPPRPTLPLLPLLRLPRNAAIPRRPQQLNLALGVPPLLPGRGGTSLPAAAPRRRGSAPARRLRPATKQRRPARRPNRRRRRADHRRELRARRAAPHRLPLGPPPHPPRLAARPRAPASSGRLPAAVPRVAAGHPRQRRGRLLLQRQQPRPRLVVLLKRLLLRAALPLQLVQRLRLGVRGGAEALELQRGADQPGLRVGALAPQRLQARLGRRVLMGWGAARGVGTVLSVRLGGWAVWLLVVVAASVGGRGDGDGGAVARRGAWG